MIIVALGTQKFQMTRLVRAVDELAADIDEEIFIQIGNTDYEPVNCKAEKFVEGSVFQKMIEECSLLITHSGVGTIMKGINAGKPVVVVPRLARYNEHVDDHQVQIADAFASKNCVIKCEEVSELKDAVNRAWEFCFEPYSEPESKIEDIIIDFLSKL